MYLHANPFYTDNGLDIYPLIIESPIFFPKKHTKCSYRGQQRAAKKRRRRR